MRGYQATYLAGAAAIACSLSHAAVASDLQTLAVEVGLTPQNIIVSGFRAIEVPALAANLANAVHERDGLTQANTQLDTAMNAYALALATPADDPAYELQIEAAASAVQQAKLLVVVRKQELVTAVVDGFDADRTTRALVTTLGSSQSLPAELRVVTWTEAEYAKLMMAVAAERRAIARGRQFSGGHADLLLEARARPEVAAASAALDSRLTDVSAAFELAF